jgi:outer membrane protein assembly factor BamB
VGCVAGAQPRPNHGQSVSAMAPWPDCASFHRARFPGSTWRRLRIPICRKYCSSTPATDGQRIAAIFGSEGLFCFDMEGTLFWKKRLGPMDSAFYRVPTARWGFASSPVTRDGKVVVLCDVLTNSCLAAFDVTDGRELWRTPRQDMPTWGTPDPGATNAAIACAHARLGNYMQTPLVVGDQLYACFDIGVLTCFDAKTGAIRHRECLGKGAEGFTSSPVSDGRDLFFASELGNVFVVPATATFSVLVTNALEETCMATPALSNGTVFYRTREHIVAIGQAAAN